MFTGLKTESLKKKLLLQESKDQATRASIRAALGSSQADLIDIHLRKDKVILRAKNKPAANELFMRKEEIKKLLPAMEIQIQ